MKPSRFFSEVQWRPVDRFSFLTISGLSLLFYLTAYYLEVLFCSDTQGYANLHHYFLNNILVHNELPSWAPFHGHGTSVNLLVSFALSIFVPFEVLIGFLFKTVNTYTLSLFTLWGYELIMLLGALLLGKELFKNHWITFFLCASLVIPVVPLHNNTAGLLHYYLLPLMLFLIHSGFRLKSLPRIIFSASLILVSTFANVPYYIPIHTLIWSIFVFGEIILNGRTHLRELFAHSLTQHKKQIAFSIFFTLSLVVFLGIMGKVGLSDNVFVLGGRLEDGSVPLSEFLTYAGNSSSIKYLEFILGINLDFDLSIYSGFIATYLGLFGFVIGTSRKSKPRHTLYSVAFLITILLVGATIISVALFYSFPLMKYFRYIGTINSVLRVWLIVLACFALERILEKQNPKKIIASIVQTGSWISLWLLVFDLFQGGEYYYKLFRSFDVGSNPVLKKFDSNLMFNCELAAVIFLIVQIVVVSSLKRAKNRFSLLPVVIILNVSAGLLFKFTFGLMPTPSSRGHDVWSLYEPHPLPYQKQRRFNYFDSPEFTKLYPYLFFKEDQAKLKRLPYFEQTLTYPGIFTEGGLAGTQQDIDLVLRYDACHSIFRKARYNQSVFDYMYLEDPALAKADIFENYRFTKNYLRYFGCTHDKIQFFSHATSDVTSIRTLIKEKIPFDALGVEMPEPRRSKWPDFPPLIMRNLPEKSNTTDLTGTIDYQVTEFSSNRLTIDVRTERQEPFWLFVSQPWDRYWKAFDDTGRELPIFQANVGFQAIPLEQNGIIRLKYVNPFHTIMYFCFFMTSSLFLFWFFVSVGEILSVRKPT